jgi:ATP-dependent helicase/nuclease subunit A
MVLVRRRNEFVSELLSALKQRRVPVAGADRLILTEQLAVQDLMALGRFLLFPDDDLTLAAVLKGPLFAISEETLFDLAHGRGDTHLWDRLRSRAAADGALRQVAERLSALLARADFAPPYELYAEILSAEGGRRALAERLGPEAEDTVEEFLALSLAYEREHVPSLQGFLRWIAAGNTEVKRDFGARPWNEIRILTVHGANPKPCYGPRMKRSRYGARGPSSGSRTIPPNGKRCGGASCRNIGASSMSASAGHRTGFTSAAGGPAMRRSRGAGMACAGPE